MTMPGRKYTAPNSNYRYGFNGKELDKEVAGTTTYDYGFRIYSPALGKFLSVDPLTQSYPWYTPYQFAGNTTIQAIDLDGLEEYHYLRLKDNEGKVLLIPLEVKDIVRQTVTKWKVGRGGLYPVEYGTVKNENKIFIVHQSAEYVIKGEEGKYTYAYEKTVNFKSLKEAQDASDKDYAATWDDFGALLYGGASAIFDGQSVFDISEWEDGDHAGLQFPGGGGKSNVAFKKVKDLLKSAAKNVKNVELHHLTPRSLRNLPFVKKAIEGGFKINGLKNLTPLEKFFKHLGTGVHAKHPKYTDQIKNFLVGLDVSKFTPEKAKEVISKLNTHILDRIKASEGVKLNDLDLKLKDFKF